MVIGPIFPSMHLWSLPPDLQGAFSGLEPRGNLTQRRKDAKGCGTPKKLLMIAQRLTDLEPGEGNRKSGGAVLRRRPIFAATNESVAVAVRIVTD
jgi:hypothetical protein